LLPERAPALHFGGYFDYGRCGYLEGFSLAAKRADKQVDRLVFITYLISMSGLQEIRAINEHAQAVWEDKQRQARGLKPKTEIAEVLRKVRARRQAAASTASKPTCV